MAASDVVEDMPPVDDVPPVDPLDPPDVIPPVAPPVHRAPTHRTPPPARPTPRPMPQPYAKSPSCEIVKIDGTDNFISGAVVFNGRGVGGVSLEIVNGNYAILRQYKGTTAADGGYNIGPLPDGDYHVYATASDNPGYFNRFTMLVTLRGGQMAKMPPLAMGKEIFPISPKVGDTVSVSPQGLKVLWTECEGTAQYRVTISDTSAKQKVAETVQTTPAALIDREVLKSGNTYQVSIRAYNSTNEFIGGTGGCGPTLWRFTVK